MAKSKGNKPKKRTPKSSNEGYFDRGPSKDMISRYLNFKKMVPERFRGTDEFLDIVSWNIRWFDHKDPARIKVIGEVLKQVNADLFVFTEIAEDGALDDVAKILVSARVGQYSCAYGSTGGQQRVAMMWDRDWVRAKKNPVELFGDQNLTVKAEDGRKADVFPRLPFWGYFEGLPDDPSEEGFNFELTGVHLKSQMPPRGFSGGRFGINQRSEAANRLAQWLSAPEQHYDEDMLIVGDWNAAPGLEEWKPLRDLELAGEVVFEKANSAGEITHVARLNKSGPAGTRLDLHLISKPADALVVPREKAVVIQWKLFEHLSEVDGKLRGELYKQMRKMVSDHLAVVTRFYFTNAGPR